MTEDFYTLTEDFIEIFKFNRSTDEAVEQWAQALDHHIENTPGKDNFYILLDVSGEGVTFTELARSYSKQIFGKYKKRKGYIAFLFEWRTSPYFARLFFAAIGKIAFKLNYFHQADAAYAWLHEMYRQHHPD